MKNLHYFAAAVLAASLLVACQSPSKEGEGVITVPVRTQLAQQDVIPVSDDVEKIEYIPLETGDSCLVSNILSMQVSRDYLLSIMERPIRSCSLTVRVNSCGQSGVRVTDLENIRW